MNDEKKTYAGWAIVQQMGHVKIAGYVTEARLAGFGVLSVAIPDGDRMVEKLIPPSTLYDLTWVGEEEARLVAKRHPIEPVAEWDVRQEVRERITQEERDSIERTVRRAADGEHQTQAAEERRRVIEILSDAKAVARTAAEVLPEGDFELEAANRLVEAIDAYARDSHQRLRGEQPPARTYSGGGYDDDRYEDDDDDGPPL